jgi:hypothetical protein
VLWLAQSVLSFRMMNAPEIVESKQTSTPSWERRRLQWRLA